MRNSTQRHSIFFQFHQAPDGKQIYLRFLVSSVLLFIFILISFPFPFPFLHLTARRSCSNKLSSPPPLSEIGQVRRRFATESLQNGGLYRPFLRGLSRPRTAACSRPRSENSHRSPSAYSDLPEADLQERRRTFLSSSGIEIPRRGGVLRNFF